MGGEGKRAKGRDRQVGKFKRMQFLTLPRLSLRAAKPGIAWIWMSPTAAETWLTMAMGTVGISIIKQCGHVTLPFIPHHLAIEIPIPITVLTQELHVR